MKQVNAQPVRERESARRPERTPSRLTVNDVEPPKMRVVSKGWSYRESLATQEQVEQGQLG